MKRKILLSLCIFIGLNFVVNAQTFFSEDFNNQLSGWMNESLDGDTNIWYIDTTMGVTDPFAFNFSWNGNPFTPDDILVTPAIDLTSATGSITLAFDCRAGSDTTYFAEHYAVYVVTSNSAADIINATPVIEETLDMQHALGVVNKTIDISSFAGQTVYVAFRHFSCTDQWLLGIDNILITGPGGATTSITDRSTFNGFGVYPNPIAKTGHITLFLEKSSVVNFKVSNLLGETLYYENKENINAGRHQFSFNGKDFSAGIYNVTVSVDGKTFTKKVIISE